MENTDAKNMEQAKYMEQFLYKKEANGKWVEFWVICRGNFLLFYSHRCEVNELRDAFRGFIELTPGTKCLIGKRKKYHFPFFLSTSKAKYYFKTPSLLLRHQWIYAIDLSLEGKEPESPPTILPRPGMKKTPERTKKESPTRHANISLDSTSSETAEIEAELISDSPELPHSVIMVTNRSDNSAEVTNFLGENISPNRISNYQVTDFLAPRNDNGNSNGFVNLSFEDDTVAGVDLETVSPSSTKCPVSWVTSSPKSQQTGMKSSVFSSSSPSYQRPDKWVKRTIRSAESNRGSTSSLLMEAEQGSGNFLNVKPVSSVNTNRFSRHLISSAPDLKLMTVEQL